MEQDPNTQKHLDEFNRIQKERQRVADQIALYNRAKDSPFFPAARWLRMHRRGIAAASGILALGASAAIAFWPSNEELSSNAVINPTPTNSESFTPTANTWWVTVTSSESSVSSFASSTESTVTPTPISTASAALPSETLAQTTSEPPSTQTTLETGIREPDSTITIRGSFSTATSAYVCEDLIFSAYQQRRICTEDEQELFDSSKDQLESFSNTLQVFTAFPPRYQPVDRSAMGLAACSHYEQGASRSDVGELLQQWYPVASFNTDILARKSLEIICPQFAN